MIGAVVLAGGRSRRFGSEKAMAEIAGEPMIGRVVRALGHGVDRVAISARRGSLAWAYATEHDLDRLPDQPGDIEGPLAGICAGLRWAVARRYTGLATAPCDAPFLPYELVSRLVGAGYGVPTVARTPRGIEPLCAYWPAFLLGQLEQFETHPPMQAILAQLHAIEAPFENAEAFANLNTPEELRSATARLSLG